MESKAGRQARLLESQHGAVTEELCPTSRPREGMTILAVGMMQKPKEKLQQVAFLQAHLMWFCLELQLLALHITAEDKV